MNKHLIRFVAFLLAPCLISDQAMASTLRIPVAPLGQKVSGNYQSAFNQEAIPARLRQFLRESDLEQRYLSALQIKTESRIALSPAAAPAMRPKSPEKHYQNTESKDSLEPYRREVAVDPLTGGNSLRHQRYYARLSGTEPRGPVMKFLSPFLKPIKLVIWDFHDTIWRTPFARILARIAAGGDPPPEIVQEMRALLNEKRQGREHFYTLLYKRLGVSDFETYNTFRREADAAEMRFSGEGDLVYGVREKIIEVRKAGISQVVLTSRARPVQEYLGKVGLNDYFNGVYGAADKTEKIRELLARFGYDPDEVVIIGNSADEENAAQETGINCIFLAFTQKRLNSYTTMRSGAGKVNVVIYPSFVGVPLVELLNGTSQAPIQTYQQNEAEMDIPLLKPAHDPSQTWIQAVRLTPNDESVQKVRTFLLGMADLHVPYYAVDLFYKLANGLWLTRGDRHINPNGLYRVVVDRAGLADPSKPFPRGHASDRGTHVFMDRRPTSEPEWNEEAARLLHEFGAFLGLDHIANTALESFFRYVLGGGSLERGRPIEVQDLQKEFQDRLGPELAVGQDVLATLDSAFRYLTMRGQRPVDLLTKMSLDEDRSRFIETVAQKLIDDQSRDFLEKALPPYLERVENGRKVTSEDGMALARTTFGL